MTNENQKRNSRYFFVFVILGLLICIPPVTAEFWNRSDVTLYTYYDGDDVRVNGSLYADSFHGDGGNLTNISGNGNGNPFNQDLNTTDSVLFLNLNINNIFFVTGDASIKGHTTLANTTIGDNGIDYIEINGTGGILLHGDARVRGHVTVLASDWVKTNSFPLSDFVGLFPIYKFDALVDRSVYYSLRIPYEIHKFSDIIVSVDWCQTVSAHGGTVCWILEYIGVDVGGTVDGSTSSTTKTSIGNNPLNTLTRTTFSDTITIDDYPDIALKLTRDISEDTLIGNANLIQVHFDFVENKLGESI